MSRSITSKKIDEIIKFKIHPKLKKIGFKKNARSFHRKHSEIIEVINFQSSMWNDPSKGRFTVNIDIVLPYFHEVWTGMDLPSNPGSAAKLAQMRLGELMPDNCDKWWDVTETTNVEEIGSEIWNAIDTYGIRFLDGFDVNAFLNRLETEERVSGVIINQEITIAIVYGFLNEYRKAYCVINQLKKTNTLESFEKTINLIEHRLKDKEKT